MFTEAEESLRGETGPLSPSLSSCGWVVWGCLSKKGCGGSKLIIQRAVNLSKASVVKLRRSKGLFQQKVLNIPELMEL